ncbi:MAG: VpsR-related response regulator [Pseudomonadota bacterium]|nr:VpsR-related response regulator [Pseudomonadota bacterium]
MKWIALVPICSVRDQHLRDAISTFFYDYHTVPVDLDRLFGTLGHAYGMVAIGEAASRRGEADSSSHRLVGTSAAMRGVQRAIDTPYIKPSDLGLEKRRRTHSFGTLNDARLQAEKAVISRTLRSTSYNVAKAARLLCVSRGTLYKLCGKFGFDLRSGSRDTGHTGQ